MSNMFRPYRSILERTSGVEILRMLWIAAIDNGADINQPKLLIFPYSRLAEEAGVSRAHVRRLILDCEKLGLLESSGVGGREITVFPAFYDFFQNLVAARFAQVSRAGYLAQDAMSSPPNISS